MVNKNDVIEFVEVIKRKALDSIDEKYKALITAEEDRFLANHSDLAEHLEKMDQLRLKFIETKKEADSTILEYKIDGRHSMRSYYKNWNKLDSDNYTSYDYRACFFSQYNIKEIVELEELQDKLIKETKDAYTVVFDKLSRMRNASSMLKYLTELGFDVSKIQDIQQGIEKTKLFPCLESKELQ